MTNEHLVKRLRREVMTATDIATYLKIAPSEVKQVLDDLHFSHDLHKMGKGKNLGYYIRIRDDADSNYIISPRSNKLQDIKFAMFSDIHFGCRQTDEEGLRGKLAQAVREGYEHVYISGDIHDGNKVYKGQNNNLTAWTLEDQVAQSLNVFQDYDLHYRAIGGNHDYSWEEQGSVNPVKLLAMQMKEKGKKFEYLGTIRADVLLAGVAMRLLHGAGGSAYAISYPGQVYLRNVLGQGGLTVPIGGEDHQLQILQIGHFHTHLHYSEYGVEVVHPGNFQKPNDFTERRGLRGQRGCYFINMSAKDGQIRDFTARWSRVPGS